LLVVGWCGAGEAVVHHLPSAASVAALAAGALAVSFAAAGIATLVPRHGMAFSIVYVLVDMLIGELPVSLHTLSITHQVKLMSGLTTTPYDLSSVIAIAVIPVGWLVLGARRIARVEA
jgi:hypothetical protein